MFHRKNEKGSVEYRTQLRKTREDNDSDRRLTDPFVFLNVPSPHFFAFFLKKNGVTNFSVRITFNRQKSRLPRNDLILMLTKMPMDRFNPENPLFFPQ